MSCENSLDKATALNLGLPLPGSARGSGVRARSPEEPNNAMRSLRTILARVNQLAERAQATVSGDDIEAILKQRHERNRQGIEPPPSWMDTASDEELQRIAEGSDIEAL